jgi:AcrR family transcriptional regulator
MRELRGELRASVDFGELAERQPTGRGVTRPQMAAVQRARLLATAVAVVDELGYADATVGHITTRARVSRRTFYDLYGGREECLLAVVEGAVEDIRRKLAEAGLDGLAWRERVRVGLRVILSYLDREPALARVCVVQALSAGPTVLEYRERVLERLATVLDEGRGEGARGAGCSVLTAEGIVGAALAIVYRRLLLRERAPLTGLLGELMGMVVLPYLGPAAARRERERPLPAAPMLAPAPTAEPEEGAHDPLEGVPMRLTYRTARVLAAVAARGGDAKGPSNSEVARAAGITDPGQISKLLARLERLGLLVNRGTGGHAKGEPNAWSLTPLGSRVAAQLNLGGLRRAAA